MKTNKFFFLAAGALVLGLASCSNDEASQLNGDFKVGADDTVNFTSYIGRNQNSRAASADLNTIKETGFGIYSQRLNAPWVVGTTTATSDQWNDEVLNLKNTPVRYSGNKWEYTLNGSTVKLNWPTNGDHLNFFAYAPYFDEDATPTPTYNITDVAPSEGSVNISFVQLYDELITGTDPTQYKPVDLTKQMDLLYESKINEKRTIPNDGTTEVEIPAVDLKFKHALSRVGFKIIGYEWEDAKGTDGKLSAGQIADAKRVCAAVTSLKLISRHKNEAHTFDIVDGRWDASIRNDAGLPISSNLKKFYTRVAQSWDDDVDATLKTKLSGASISDLNALAGSGIAVIANNLTNLTKDNLYTGVWENNADQYMMVLPSKNGTDDNNPGDDTYSNVFDATYVSAVDNVEYAWYEVEMLFNAYKYTDGNTAKPFDQYKNILVKKPIKVAFEAGKAYTIVIHLGLTGFSNNSDPEIPKYGDFYVHFSVEVADWEDADNKVNIQTEIPNNK